MRRHEKTIQTMFIPNNKFKIQEAKIDIAEGRNGQIYNYSFSN